MFVIAGVTGHVGSVVAANLIDAKEKIRVIVRSAAKGQRWAAKGAEVAVGSLDDVAFLTRALEGARGFFALLPPDMQPPDLHATQQRYADAIAAAVLAAKVPHVVLLSSVGADLATGTGPILGLHDLELGLRKSGTRLSAIRAGYFQENVGMWLDSARQAGVVPSFFAADAALTMIATRDIGELAAKCLLEPAAQSEVLDLHGPPYTTREVAEIMGAALGKKLQVLEIPQAGWSDAMRRAEIPDHLIGPFCEMYAGFGSGVIKPAGDRQIRGTTPIDQTIQTLCERNTL